MNKRILLTAGVFAMAGACSLCAQQPTAAPVQPAMAAEGSAATAKGKPDDAELRKRLTPEQYHVTRESGTETPFKNAYWDNHKAGIYVDVISGKPLFSSTDKFESGTGWPSFSKPLAQENLAKITDTSLGMDRMEVRSKDSDSHIGHVFDDGPKAAGGLRYCVNSAALRFVPVDKLKDEGLGEYTHLFEKTAKKEKK